MKYLIIGGSIAGINAVEAIRRQDPHGEITVLSKEKDPPYSRPLISYWLSNVIPDQEMLYRPRDFYERQNVDLILGKRAVEIDPAGGTVMLNSGEVLEYENLLLACGGRNIVPPGLEGVNYHTFYSWEDVRRLSAEVRKKGSGQRGLIIGGGLVGMKAAESLRLLGVDVTVVDLADHLLSSILPLAAGKLLEKQLSRDEALHFYLNTTAAGIEADGDRIKCEIMGIPMSFDHLILAIGVRPNLQLCQDTTIKINRGVLVDERMRTNLSHIYAAGDIVETYDPVYGEKKVAAILPNAATQGRVAGAAMSGAEVRSDPHTVFNSLSIFGHSIVTVGLTAKDAESVPEIHGPDGYSEFFFKKQRLCGAVLLNHPERSGIYRYLIEKRIEVEKRNLSNPNLLALPGRVWLEMGLR